MKPAEFMFQRTTRVNRVFATAALSAGLWAVQSAPVQAQDNDGVEELDPFADEVEIVEDVEIADEVPPVEVSADEGGESGEDTGPTMLDELTGPVPETTWGLPPNPLNTCVSGTADECWVVAMDYSATGQDRAAATAFDMFSLRFPDDPRAAMATTLADRIRGNSTQTGTGTGTGTTGTGTGTTGTGTTGTGTGTTGTGTDTAGTGTTGPTSMGEELAPIRPGLTTANPGWNPTSYRSSQNLRRARTSFITGMSTSSLLFGTYIAVGVGENGADSGTASAVPVLTGTAGSIVAVGIANSDMLSPGQLQLLGDGLTLASVMSLAGAGGGIFSGNGCDGGCDPIGVFVGEGLAIQVVTTFALGLMASRAPDVSQDTVANYTTPTAWGMSFGVWGAMINPVEGGADLGRMVFAGGLVGIGTGALLNATGPLTMQETQVISLGGLAGLGTSLVILLTNAAHFPQQGAGTALAIGELGGMVIAGVLARRARTREEKGESWWMSDNESDVAWSTSPTSVVTPGGRSVPGFGFSASW